MNARVEAGPLTLSLNAVVIEPTVNTQVKAAISHGAVTWTCLSLAPLSVNGHSISAINPQSTLTGGMATLAMA